MNRSIEQTHAREALPTKTISEQLLQLQEELNKNPKNREIRNQILELKRELNRTKQFTEVSDNKLIEGKSNLDSVSADRLLRI
jgi:ribosome-interacting GTPase 1